MNNPTTRPCIVKGTPCKFHMFARNDKIFVNTEIAIPERDAYLIARKAERRGVCPAGFSAQVVATTEAVIEWPDGSVTLEPVNKIRFTDREEALE